MAIWSQPLQRAVRSRMQDITLTIPDATPRQDYTVRIERAANDAFGIGSYALAVGYNFTPGGYVAPTSSTTYNNPGLLRR